MESLHDIQNEIPSHENVEHYELHYEEVPRHASDFDIKNDEPHLGLRRRQKGVSIGNKFFLSKKVKKCKIYFCYSEQFPFYNLIVLEMEHS